MQNVLRGPGSRALLGLLLVFLTILAGAPGGGAGAAAAAVEARDAGILVAFRAGISAPARAGAVQRLGLDLDPSFQSNFLVRVRVSARARAAGLESARALRQLRRDPTVRRAEPDYPVRVAALPNDPRFHQLWALHNSGQTGGAIDADIDWPEAVEIAGRAAGPVVAVLDTGVDFDHPDLRDNILRAPDGAVVGWDFANNDSNPTDDHGHGTHVAGTIAARVNNGIGIVGVCPTARIVPVKFLKADGTGSTSDAIRALDFAVAAGARVVNNSWGGGGFSEFLLEAIHRARTAGVLVVAAAGNDASDNDAVPTYPASYNRYAENVLSVAASDAKDRLAAFSNYGRDSVDLAAPGVGIVSTAIGGGYTTMSGTSMAAPHVAGAAALTLSRYPDLPLSQLRERLLNNLDHPSSLGTAIPQRRLNVAKAMVDDTTPPAMPVAFSVSHFAASGLLLSWTASGDDGAAGTASRYELRYSSTALDESNFEDGVSVAGLPVPGLAGTPETFLLANLTPDQDLFVALRAVDKVGNTSRLATLGRIRTPAESEAVPVMFDDAEGGARFVGSLPWAVSNEQSFSPTLSYSDNPGQPYGVRVDSSLTQSSPVLLTGFVPVLTFYVRTDLETGFDFLYVEVSADDGLTWTRQELAITGVEGWRQERVSLGRYYGQRVRVRFRLISDEVVSGQGVWLDDIRIAGDRLVPGSVAPPDAPAAMVARAVVRNRVDLAWLDRSDNEASFKIERRSGPGPFTTVATVGANVATYADASVAANTLYRYRVRASNAGGDSAPSDEAEVLTIPEPPPPPGSLRAEALETEVRLQWNAAMGAQSYRVKRATTPGGPYLAISTAVTTEYRDQSVGAGIRYFYVVTSVGAGGESVPSTEAEATPGLVLPAPPTDVHARSKRRRVLLTWRQSESPDVVLNRIYRSRSVSGPYELVATVKARRKFQDRRLGQAGVYYYRVSVVDLAGRESPQSEQVSASVGRFPF